MIWTNPVTYSHHKKICLIFFFSVQEFLWFWIWLRTTVDLLDPGSPAPVWLMWQKDWRWDMSAAGRKGNAETPDERKGVLNNCILESLLKRLCLLPQSALVFWLSEGVDGIQLSGVEQVTRMVPSLWTDIRAIIQNGTDKYPNKRSEAHRMDGWMETDTNQKKLYSSSTFCSFLWSVFNHQSPDRSDGQLLRWHRVRRPLLHRRRPAALRRPLCLQPDWARSQRPDAVFQSQSDQAGLEPGGPPGPEPRSGPSEPAAADDAPRNAGVHWRGGDRAEGQGDGSKDVYLWL